MSENDGPAGNAPGGAAFERVLLKPKRGGTAVQLVGLVWIPTP